MKSLLLQRECKTIPITDNTFRIIITEPANSWALIFLSRFLRKKITLENTITDSFSGFNTPVLISGHYIFSLNDSMSFISNEISNDADLVLADFLLMSFQQINDSNTLFTESNVKYSSIIKKMSITDSQLFFRYHQFR